MAASIGGLLLVAGATVFYGLQERQGFQSTIAALDAEARGAANVKSAIWKTRPSSCRPSSPRLEDARQDAEMAFSSATADMTRLESELATAERDDLESARNLRGELAATAGGA